MTRKHKPTTAHKKRPAAQPTKPVKPVPTEKTVAAVASLRDKERGKVAAPAKKGAPAARPAAAHGKAEGTRAANAAAGKLAADKRPLGIERRVPAMPEDRQSQLKLLIARGKEQGYLTYAQVNDHLPSEIVDPEQIEDIVNTINDMGIPVYEKAPDTESLLATEPSQPADEEAIEEAAAALAALDAELGRTTDPVRMYMREMGTVELLTREGEIRIAKRIEEGLDAVRLALANYPPTSDFLRAPTSRSRPARRRLVDIIVGFIDPNAPDVIAQPQNPTKLEVASRPRRRRKRKRKARRRTTARRKPSTPARIRKRRRTRFAVHRQDPRPGARLDRQARRQGSEDAASQRKRLSDEFMELQARRRACSMR